MMPCPLASLMPAGPTCRLWLAPLAALSLIASAQADAGSALPIIGSVTGSSCALALSGHTIGLSSGRVQLPLQLNSCRQARGQLFLTGMGTAEGWFHTSLPGVNLELRYDGQLIAPGQALQFEDLWQGELVATLHFSGGAVPAPSTWVPTQIGATLLFF